MEESFDFRREAAHAWYTLQYRRIPGHEGRTVMQPLSSSRIRPPASRFKLEAMMTLHQPESPHLKPPYSSLSPCCSSSSSDTSPLSSSSSSPSLSSSSPLFSSSLSPSSPSLYSSSSSLSSSHSPSSPSDSSSSLYSSSSLIPSSSSSTKAIASNKQWILLVAPLSKSTPSMVSHHMSSSPTIDSDLGNPKEDPKVEKEDDENEDLKNVARPWKKRGLKMKVLNFLHKLGLSSPKSSHDLRRRRRDDCEFEISGRSHVIYRSGYLLRSESPKSRLPFTPPEAITTLQMLF